MRIVKVDSLEVMSSGIFIMFDESGRGKLKLKVLEINNLEGSLIGWWDCT